MIQYLKSKINLGTLLPFIVGWCVWVSYNSWYARDLDQVNKILHQRITATKNELTSEDQARAGRIEEELKKLEQRLNRIESLHLTKEGHNAKTN